jgi:hypothetical protein
MKFLWARLVFWLWLPFFAHHLCAEEANHSQPLGAPGFLSGKKFQEKGQTYVLISSRSREQVETEEYGIEGETVTSWSQLITCQRLSLPTALGADEYTRGLKHRIEETDENAHFRILQQSKAAAIFGVSYGQTRNREEPQFALVLVLADPSPINQIRLVQYTANPAKMSAPILKAQVERWQARFLSRAISDP